MEGQQILLAQHGLQVIKEGMKRDGRLRALGEGVPPGVGGEFVERALTIQVEKLVSCFEAGADEDAEDDDMILLRVADGLLQPGIIVGLRIKEPVGGIDAVADQKNFAAIGAAGPMFNQIGQRRVDAGVANRRAESDVKGFGNCGAVGGEGLIDTSAAVQRVSQSDGGIRREGLNELGNVAELSTEVGSGVRVDENRKLQRGIGAIQRNKTDYRSRVPVFMDGDVLGGKRRRGAIAMLGARGDGNLKSAGQPGLRILGKKRRSATNYRQDENNKSLNKSFSAHLELPRSISPFTYPDLDVPAGILGTSAALALQCIIRCDTGRGV